MPEKKTLERARKDAREGKSPSTQAGEFVREEMEHIRQGKHGTRSTKQAIAVGLSKARRAGVKLPPPKAGATSERTRKQAARNYAQGQTSGSRPASRTGSRATRGALEREGKQAASHTALSRQARTSAPQSRRSEPKTSGAKSCPHEGRSRIEARSSKGRAHAGESTGPRWACAGVAAEIVRKPARKRQLVRCGYDIRNLPIRLIFALAAPEGKQDLRRIFELRRLNRDRLTEDVFNY